MDYIVLWIILAFKVILGQVYGDCNLLIEKGQVQEVLEKKEFFRKSFTFCYLGLNIPGGLGLDNNTWMLFDMETGESHEPNYMDEMSIARQSFKVIEERWRGSFLKSWVDCCVEAESCCANETVGKVGGCPQVWDGLHCLREADPNTELVFDCPDRLYPNGFQPKSLCPRKMSKLCGLDGLWTTYRNDCNHYEFQRAMEAYNSSDDSNMCCRTERGMELSLPFYKLDTCARCYKYLPRELLFPPLWYFPDFGGRLWLITKNTSEEFWAIPDGNSSNVIYQSFQHLDYLRQNWEDCCNAALDCCLDHLSKRPQNISGTHCPRTWDGWSCIPEETPAGSKAHFSCAPHIYNYNRQSRQECIAIASRECLGNGTWFINYNRNPPVEYTDYSTCNRAKESKNEYYFNIAMCSISMAALLPALIIFHLYRQLRVNRIKMHVHFFLALFCNCLLTAVLKATIFIEMVTDKADTLVAENGAFCKILLLMTRYFRMTTYTWMVCEGFYLHRQIAAAFSEQHKFYPFLMAGWGFPLLPTIIYGILRSTGDDTLCWIVPHKYYDWIFNSLNLLFLFLNLLFLSHIIYILVTKLTSIQSNEQNHFKKAVRATIILIPLFGIHYVLIIYHPTNPPCDTLTFYNHFSLFIEGLQGLCVAILFCYINSEVLTLLKRSWSRYRMRTNLVGERSRGRLSLSTQVSTVHDLSRRGTTGPNNNHLKVPTTEL